MPAAGDSGERRRQCLHECPAGVEPGEVGRGGKFDELTEEKNAAS
jgi:hypothetical protein